jgi:hypothetical protein
MILDFTRKTTYLQTHLSYLLLITNMLIVFSATAQEEKSKRHMVSKQDNFTFFSNPIRMASEAQWKQFNDPKYYNHPEFGYRPYDSPDAEVVEVLSMRNSKERFYINPNQPSEIYKQTFYAPMHFMYNGHWISINSKLAKKEPGVYEASVQPEPLGFDIRGKFSYIQTVKGTIHFNDWTLYSISDGSKTQIAKADWSNYTAGDDGLYIIDVFPGVDLKMLALTGGIKSEFIVKQPLNQDADYYLFEDSFSTEDAQKTGFNYLDGEVALINSDGEGLLKIEDPVIYLENAPQDQIIFSEYEKGQNSLGIRVSCEWLSQQLQHGRVIIDPLVTSIPASLNQASITGSQYNASCGFDNSCNFYLNVTPPANATITNAFTSFDYRASYPCGRSDGAVRYGVGGCVSPSESSYYWYCPAPSSGDCEGSSTPIGADISACYPPGACTGQVAPLQFSLQFFRRCKGNQNCSNGCISSDSNWSVTIQGYTLQYASTNVNQQITLSTTTVCPGGPITATANVQYGVPPYTVNWSLNNTGTPSIGTGLSITPVLTNPGANTIYCFVTDACGSTITSSRNITVTNPSAGPNVTSPVNYCIGATATPLTSPGTGLKWYSTATGGTQLGSAPVPSTTAAGTTSYWVSQTVSGCESQRSQIDVIVHPSPTVTGTPIITPSQCDSPTGSITGISTTAPGPITYTWYNSTGDVLSTSTTSSDLTNQPGGEYSLMITDGNGCQGTQGGYIIPLDAAPVAPTVVSPINYCHYDPAQPLEAIGSSLMWHTDASLTNGSVTAPTPNTNLTLTTNYFVTQTINGCESIPAQITAIVKPKPSLPTVTSPVSYCQFETPETLTANGTDLLWYTTSSGGTGSSTL